ncbi:MAG TPA: dihydrodipicolinate synthase family protein [Fimbriimonadaceae bacterium]|mgnify:CR=1 FL=1|nr:dihydrodipicolinate synthase family protein [Fimbriimonadaceae bacterium]
MKRFGVYPASVTPFDGKGRVDMAQMAKLLAWFEAAGCAGVVLAGTNGEGPSLSAVEKRDLLRDSANLAGGLELVLGIATPSLDEATWLTKQAATYGASAVLVMAPSYFRAAPEEGVLAWFEALLAASPTPVLVYNFPKMTGFTFSPEAMGRLAGHPNFLGLKDSSGEGANLALYRAAVSDDHVLYVGDETLLLDAIDAGWSGTISGASNVIPQWLVGVLSAIASGNRETAEARFSLTRPCIEAIRSLPQPPGNKALLHRLGVLSNPGLRLPLLEADKARVDAVADLIRERLGEPRLGLGT